MSNSLSDVICIIYYVVSTVVTLKISFDENKKLTLLTIILSLLFAWLFVPIAVIGRFAAVLYKFVTQYPILKKKDKQ